jgi:DNA-binding CsgD family transcriptional regulator
MAREGYHQFRDWQPSDRQRQVLDLLVEGKNNAEIALALDVTPDGVKWHISELLGETGLDDRQALARWWVEEKARRRQPAFLPPWPLPLRLAIAGSAAVVVLVIVAGWLVWDRGDSGEAIQPLVEVAADVAPTPTPTPQPTIDAGPPPPCDTPLPGGFRIVTAEELRAEGLVEFGRVIEPRSCPLQVANRADLAFFWLADGGEIDLEQAGLHILGAFGPYYRGSNYPPSDIAFYYDGELFRVAMWVQDQGRPVFVGTDAPNAEVVIEGRERIVVNRVGSEGAFAGVTLEGEESGRHRLAFASDGTLFFDPTGLPGSLATNWTTGESIDVSRMTKLGQLELVPAGYPEFPSTGCYGREGPPVCKVGLPAISRPVALPVGGVLTCVPVMSAGREKQGYELDTGAFVLRAAPAGGYGMPWDHGCPSRTVSPGEELPMFTYTSLSAFRADGSPLSIVITRDGHLYIGDVTLELDCPCMIGN